MSERASSALFERARTVIPAGTHSNSRARPDGPLYLERAEGAFVWDVDGNRLLDCTMGNGSVILGHGDPRVVAATHAASARGLSTGYESAESVEAIELLASIVPGFGQARFANSGTEALMHALSIARAATGRDGVAKVEGAYHGWFDLLFVSCWPAPDLAGAADRPSSPPASGGLSRHAAETVVLPFNDADACERILRERAHELAAVVLEPVMIDIGYVPATHEYLERVRAVTAELGIVLIFDELLTGFRVAPGGARELYGIHPDLTTFGKAISNGVAAAVLEGRYDLMALTDPLEGGPVGYVGTYNGSAPAVAASCATLRALADGEIQRRLDVLTRRLVDGFHELAARHGVAVTMMGGGGHFQPYFCDGPIRSYRDAARTSAASYTVLRETMAARGVLIAEKPLLHSALSAAHDETDVDLLLEISDEALAAIAG